MTDSELIADYESAKRAHEATTAGTSGRVKSFILLLAAELRLRAVGTNSGA